MKRLNFWLPLVTTVLIGAMTPNAVCQETNSIPPTASVSLDTLVTEALEKNPELKFYEAELAVARAGRKSAGLWANPEVSGSIGQKRTTAGGLSEEGLAWSASVVQPFEWPGRMGLRKAIANRDIELAELGYQRFKVALASRVRTLAYGLFAAQEKSAAASEVAERFKALREILIQRDPAGLTPLLETRVIEATELNAQRKATEAQLAVDSALLELNQLRGQPTGTRVVIAPSQLDFRPLEERERLLALARTNNFEMRMRAAELAQQGFRVDLARNERYPAISVGPSISEENAGDRERIIGVAVSLPLPLWNRNSGNIEVAKARQTQAEVSLQVTEREIQRQVLAAALTYETKLREMAKWRPDSVQHFKEAAELADRHYRLGAVPISTYVELQQQYLEAVESLLDTKREALAAAAQLEVLTGLPEPLARSTAGGESK
ncbi:MAG TPA: TolC family protein [Verrucomicrobiae bacterium]|nr:TolC family protein [Verrucomicrobiae bacterium]